MSEIERLYSIGLFLEALAYIVENRSEASSATVEECLLGCFKMGWFEEGEKYLDLLEADSDLRDACYKAGAVYCSKNGQRIDWVKAHPELFPTPRFWIELATSALENERPENAFVAVSQIPDYHANDLLVEIAEACFKAGWSESGLGACRLLGIKPKREWLESGLKMAQEFNHQEYIKWLTLLLEQGEFSS